MPLPGEGHAFIGKTTAASFLNEVPISEMLLPTPRRYGTHIHRSSIAGSDCASSAGKWVLTIGQSTCKTLQLLRGPTTIISCRAPRSTPAIHVLFPGCAPCFCSAFLNASRFPLILNAESRWKTHQFRAFHSKKQTQSRGKIIHAVKMSQVALRLLAPITRSAGNP